MSITIGYLQEYIRANDYRPELKEKYFMKLAEEVGELSRTILMCYSKNMTAASLGRLRLRSVNRTYCLGVSQ